MKYIRLEWIAIMGLVFFTTVDGYGAAKGKKKKVKTGQMESTSAPVRDFDPIPAIPPRIPLADALDKGRFCEAYKATYDNYSRRLEDIERSAQPIFDLPRKSPHVPVLWEALKKKYQEFLEGLDLVLYPNLEKLPAALPSPLTDGFIAKLESVRKNLAIRCYAIHNDCLLSRQLSVAELEGALAETQERICPTREDREMQAELNALVPSVSGQVDKPGDAPSRANPQDGSAGGAR